MSYSFYSFLHILAVLVMTMSLSAMAFQIFNGASKDSLKNRKGLSMTHGIALLVVFVAGFGLMARAGYKFSSASWLYVKLLSWLLLGMYPLFLYKKWIPQKMAPLGLVLILALAVYTVVFKPF